MKKAPAVTGGALGFECLCLGFRQAAADRGAPQMRVVVVVVVSMA